MNLASKIFATILTSYFRWGVTLWQLNINLSSEIWAIFFIFLLFFIDQANISDVNKKVGSAYGFYSF